jgi:hypothetical protein
MNNAVGGVALRRLLPLGSEKQDGNVKKMDYRSRTPHGFKRGTCAARGTITRHLATGLRREIYGRP